MKPACYDAMSDLLSVKINSPQKIVWEGMAKSVSSTNSQGPFDILPQHANFVTIIENQPIKIVTEREKLEFKFHLCFMYTHNDFVFLYTL